jgi:hypothetical protein
MQVPIPVGRDPSAFIGVSAFAALALSGNNRWLLAPVPESAGVFTSLGFPQQVADGETWTLRGQIWLSSSVAAAGGISLNMALPGATNFRFYASAGSTAGSTAAPNSIYVGTIANVATLTGGAGICKVDASGAPGQPAGFTFEIFLDRAIGNGLMDLQFKRFTPGETYTVLPGSFVSIARLGP